MNPSPAAERDRYLAFAFAAADLLVETDEAGRIGYAAGAARAFAGVDEGALVGRELADLVRASDRALVGVMLAQAVRGGRVGPVAVASADGRVAARATAMGLAPGQPVRVALSDMGGGPPGPRPGRDAATGLLDRDAFTALAERHVGRAGGGGGPGAAAELSFFGLDGLAARVEEEARREALLRRLAAVLRLASVGGDAAGLLSDRRLAVVHPTGTAPGIERRLAAEIAADAPPGATLAAAAPSRRTLALAEAALSPEDARRALAFAVQSFAAEAGAPPAFRSLDEALARRLDATARRVGEVRRTIARTEFSLVFQPVVSLADGRVHHHEALSRFSGGRAPAAVIPFAEDAGLIADLDLAVCRMALAHLGELAAAGRPASIAVNLSARSLESDAFVEAARRLCSQAGGTARRLMFEITETSAIRDLERAAGVVRRLRRDGHQVSLDDFGAGASAFHYLRALPVDQVKLDGAYTRRLLTDPRDASILRGMVAMCKGLRLTTVAEMVEEEAQAAELARAGVELGQGWLFGRPAPTALGDDPSQPARPPPSPRPARRQGPREEWR